MWNTIENKRINPALLNAKYENEPPQRIQATIAIILLANLFNTAPNFNDKLCFKVEKKPLFKISILFNT